MGNNTVSSQASMVEFLHASMLNEKKYLIRQIGLLSLEELLTSEEEVLQAVGKRLKEERDVGRED